MAEVVAKRFTGFTITPEREAQIERERRQEAERAERRKRSEAWEAFIGERTAYADCDIADWCFSKDYRTAQQVIVDGVAGFIREVRRCRATGTGAVFYGPPGTGKDYLATCIIREACLVYAHSAKYVNGMDWFVSLRDSMGDGGKSEGEIIKHATYGDWMVLSDPLPPIGDLTPYQSQMLYRLIDERSTRGKPTIVTLNVADGKEAVSRMGAATWDRMKHDAWVFACDWPSFRKPRRVFGV